MTPHDYLARLQAEAQQNHTRELYLWPRTPVSNLQAEAWQRVGVSDWRADDPHSRPARVMSVIGDLLYNRLIPERFSVVDVCCGDALIPWHIKRRWPMCKAYGVDLNAGRLQAHFVVQDQGVRLFRIPLQRLFRDGNDVTFDVAMMFNTYRGWDRADLHEDERWIVGAADEWFRRHARYTLLTATEEQVARLKGDGWWVTELGAGEDDSRMILMWPCATGELEGLWQAKRGCDVR